MILLRLISRIALCGAMTSAVVARYLYVCVQLPGIAVVLQPAGVEAMLLTDFRLPLHVAVESRSVEQIWHESFFERPDRLPNSTDWAGGYVSWYTGRGNSGLNLGFRHWLIIGALSVGNLILWRFGRRHSGHSNSGRIHTARQSPDAGTRETTANRTEVRQTSSREV